jgi:hypothetical protein
VFTVASKVLSLLQQRPVLLVALLVVVSLVAGRLGGAHIFGLWDGPI